MAIVNGYATLADLKSYLKIDDSVEDALLENIVEAASRSIDKIANRRFYLDSTATARYYYTANPLRVFIDDLGSLTGLVVKTEPDSAGVYADTLTASDYQLEPLNASAKGRPWTSILVVNTGTSFSAGTSLRPTVEITGRWGWPSVPDDIAQATLILSADLYKRKDSIGGVLGLSEMGAIRMSPLGRDISAMVRAYRREMFS